MKSKDKQPADVGRIQTANSPEKELESFVEFLVTTTQASIDSEFLLPDQQSQEFLAHRRDQLVSSVKYFTKLADGMPLDHERDFAYAQIWAALSASFAIGSLASVSDVSAVFLRQKGTMAGREANAASSQALKDVVRAELEPMDLGPSDTPAKLAEAILGSVRRFFPPSYKRLNSKRLKNNDRPPYPSKRQVARVISDILTERANAAGHSDSTPHAK
ncbi:MAG: hypothetical protein JWM36_701 [Hyphomicrobiales bacterium]|nr:hypothetical protein [Hyphomicrobiales bacterium]